MIVFDEGALSRALHESAESFEFTEGATDQILAQAMLASGVARTSRLKLLYRHYGHGRSAMTVAAAGLVVLGMSIPLLRHERNPVTYSAFKSPPTGITGQVEGGSHGVRSGGLAPASPHQDSFTKSGLDNAQITRTALSGVSASAARVGISRSVSSSLRVEKVGTLALTVSHGSFQSDLSKLTVIAALDGGFVGSSQIHIGTRASKSFSSGTITLQVPQGNFAKLVTQVSHVGDATLIVTSASDVTGQYVDLNARITALEVARSQYLTIMTRTSSISGILSVQSELTALQSQIEELQASLGLLNSATTYATLTVVLSEPGQNVTSTSHNSGVQRAWHDSVGGFVLGVEWLIRLAGPLLFSILLLASVWYVGRLLRRVAQRRRI